jgi:hypothetical protein
MELKPEQINKFKEINRGNPDFENYTEEQKTIIANGVANYFLTLFKIHQRIRRDSI